MASAAGPPGVFPYAQTNIQLFEQLRLAGTTAAALSRVGAATELATRLVSGQYRASGKPFICHLVGTASILAAHGAPADVVVAGLLHSAYIAGEFGDGLRRVTRRKRDVVRAAVGADVEELILAYRPLHWTTWHAESVDDRFATLDERQRRTVWIVAANELEEARDQSLRYAGPDKVKSGLRAAAIAQRIAVRLDRRALAAELRDAGTATEHDTVPDALVANRATAYEIHPLSPWGRVRRIVRGLRGGNLDLDRR